MYVANTMLSNPQSPERGEYFVMCVRGHIALSHQFEVSGTIVQGLLSMALNKSLLSAAECSLLLEELQREMQGIDAWSPSDAIHASFPLDFDLSMSDPKMATGSQLASRLDEQVLVKTVTAGGDYEAALTA